MKKMLSILLSLTLLSSPLTSWAKPGEAGSSPERLTLTALVKEDAEAFKVEFEQVLKSPEATEAKVKKIVYDLEHIDKYVVEDMKSMAAAAYNGLTEEVVVEVQRRFQAAVALLATILADKNMPVEKKKVYCRNLAEAIRVVFFRVLREHGQDEKNTSPEFKRGLFAKILLEFFNDAKSLVSARRAVKHKEIDAQGNEINAGPGPLVWQPIENIRRDELTLEVITELQEMVHYVLNQLDGGAVEDRFIPEYYGDKVIPKAIMLRKQRLFSEIFAASTYFGMAVFAFIAPVWDMVAFIDGGGSMDRSAHSLFASSLIYTSVWIVLAATKTSTISSKALNELNKLIKMTRDQTIMPTERQTRGFWSRFWMSLGEIPTACIGIFKSKKPDQEKQNK